MAWIEVKFRKDGSRSYWVRDVRDGRQVAIPAASRGEAELKLEQYVIRMDIEKEGYDDKFAKGPEEVANELFGRRIKDSDNAVG